MPGPPSQIRRGKRRAVIIGGSMSGLFSAAFLRQIGWEVDLYERSRVELVGRKATAPCSIGLRYRIFWTRIADA
jgi:2-polyprenyl-6-methoxyphenol hydroxylase-like FAD-dependent oxidoreductase